MKTQFSYKSVFGDYLLTVTGKSAARGLDNLRNARKVLAVAQDRISALQADVKERHTCTVRLRFRKDAEISRLRADIARLNAENKELKKMVTILDKRGYVVACKCDKLSRRLHDVRADRRKWRDTAERCFSSAMKNAVALANEAKAKKGGE